MGRGFPERMINGHSGAPMLDEFRMPQPDRSRETIVIRAYRPSDREVIRRLCSDTGFLGQAVAPLFQDSDLFADLFTKP
jgi:hypothetical protein